MTFGKVGVEGSWGERKSKRANMDVASFEKIDAFRWNDT